MKQIWTGRRAQAAGRYGEQAPMATVCCNVCRSCITTNLIGFATAGLAALSLGLARFARRITSLDWKQAPPSGVT
jgi:hypothetical protein